MQTPLLSLVYTCHQSNDISLSLTLLTLTFDNDETSPALAAGLVTMVTTISCFPNYRLTLFDRKNLPSFRWKSYHGNGRCLVSHSTDPDHTVYSNRISFLTARSFTMNAMTRSSLTTEHHQ